MRRRGTVAAAVLVLVTVGLAPASAQTPKPNPSPSPAAPPCQAGDALRAAGLYDDARKAYAEAAAKVGGETCAVDGLTKLPALESDRAFAIATQLKDRGLDSEARTLVVDTLKKHRDAKVPDGLRDLLTEDRTSWWTDFLDDVTPWARSIGEIVLIGLLVLVAGQFVFSRSHRRLRIGEFTGPSSDQAEAKVTRVSTEFQALVRARIHAIARAQRGVERVDLAGAAGGPVSIPATVTKVAPQAAILEAALNLLQYLLPPRERPLTGLLLVASPSRGLGVTVTLSSRFGRPRATRTFWADDLPAAAFTAVGSTTSYLPFVVPVAAWALAEFRRRPFRALGTGDPMSYAAFAIASAEQGAAW